MKILITGKTGQVGHELERSLRSLGDVIALDRSQLDLADFDQIRRVLSDVRPDWIINPAAYTAVDKAETEPDLALRINGVAPGILAEEAKKIHAAVIHYSTDYVFDGNKPTPYLASDATCPLNVYGETKLAGERAINAVGGDTLVLRTSWVYGTYGKNFLNTILRLADEKPELRIVSDQFGAPTWSRTIAEATANVIAKHTRNEQRMPLIHVPGGVMHLTAQGRTTWHEFAVEVVNLASSKAPKIIPIPSSEYPVPATRPKNSQLNCDYFEKAFGPLPHWKEALRACLAKQTVNK